MGALIASLHAPKSNPLGFVPHALSHGLLSTAYASAVTPFIIGFGEKREGEKSRRERERERERDKNKLEKRPTHA